MEGDLEHLLLLVFSIPGVVTWTHLIERGCALKCSFLLVSVSGIWDAQWWRWQIQSPQAPPVISCGVRDGPPSWALRFPIGVGYCANLLALPWQRTTDWAASPRQCISSQVCWLEGQERVSTGVVSPGSLLGLQGATFLHVLKWSSLSLWSSLVSLRVYISFC